MPRKPATPKPKPLFSRKEATGLAKRFLKSDDLFDVQKDLIALYSVFKTYPKRRFWENYELGFKLNSCLWFLGKDGQAQLSRDWDLFNLDLPKQAEYKLEEVKQGQDMQIERKPKTIADLLR